jgi:hypothetical protein
MGVAEVGGPRDYSEESENIHSLNWFVNIACTYTNIFQMRAVLMNQTLIYLHFLVAW